MTLPGVNVFGPVHVASGLGTAVRSHLRAMRAVGVKARLFPFVLSEKQGTVDFAQVEESNFFDISVAYANADATEYFLSLFGRRFTQSRYRIGVWVWELPAADPRHLAHTKVYDEIWVPSTFNQRAFSAITRTPVYLMPYAVGMTAASAKDFRAELGIPQDAFVFLYMFDASSIVERKNPGALLRAFANSFSHNASVHLILKVSYLPRTAPFESELEEWSRKLPNLHLVRDVLQEPDLASLVNAADCYVSPHRTEGFGFTLAEAMLLGKPVVATNYGSTTDFITEETGFPVAYRLVEIERDIGATYGKGAVWADIVASELSRAMELVVEQPEEATKRAEAGRRLVLHRYAESSIGEGIAKRLAAIASRLE